jgi:hypothetical protein
VLESQGYGGVIAEIAPDQLFHQIGAEALACRRAWDRWTTALDPLHKGVACCFDMRPNFHGAVGYGQCAVFGRIRRELVEGQHQGLCLPWCDGR